MSTFFSLEFFPSVPYANSLLGNITVIVVAIILTFFEKKRDKEFPGLVWLFYSIEDGSKLTGQTFV
ncbi:3214_t:CDS:2 [Funneliformis caledonium]|uniref:3214_t:CDS:1 n=1 Tax=Funneliformis caledonium TaxID=1117310 RepID=A0A9N9G672_9GLOM|nr:3214_t:CDS:2 [Funneliformis caledonium]